MTHKPRLFQALRVSAALVSAWLASTVPGYGQNLPKYKITELTLFMQPGTPRATVDNLGKLVQATKVQAIGMPDCYVLSLPETVKSEQDALGAAAKLKPNASVRWVSPTPLGYKLADTAEPNDPRYKSNEQWNLRMLNMPQAWAIQKGAPNTTLAIVDSGFLPNHEDLVGQYHPASRNFAENTTTGQAPIDASSLNNHGVHVSGIAVAKTDNNKGIAGICWENIKCVAMQVSKSADGAFSFPAVLSSWNYLAANQNALNIVACGNSFFFPVDPSDTNNPMFVATKACVDTGMIFMAAAGNFAPLDNRDPRLPVTPAIYPHVVSIGSVGPSGQPASYTSPGKVDIAAPGGDIQTAFAEGILSTFTPAPSAYEFEQGTSMACPAATAVAALMMSTPGVTAQQAIQALKDTANRSALGSTLPDINLGYGVIDAYRALQQVSVQAKILDPVGFDSNGTPSDPSGTLPPVETFSPTVRLKFGQAPIANISVTVDGTPLTAQYLTDHVESGDPTAPNPQYIIAFRPRFTPAADGVNRHTIVVSATNPNTGLTKGETRVFDIKKRVLSGFPVANADGTGRRLAFISFPYKESATDSPSGALREAKELLGPNAILYRFTYQTANGATTGDYSVFGSANDKNPENAKLYANYPFATTPPTAAGQTNVADTRPVGFAWFAELPDPVNLENYGAEFGNSTVRIPLTEGWNMVGNPFPYSVQFASTLVELPTGERLTAGAAADAGIILPFLYRFVLDNSTSTLRGNYTQFVLPNGALTPWEGHWVFVVPRAGGIDLSRKYALLVLPGITSSINRSASRSTQTATPDPSAPVVPISGANSWAMRIDAQVGSLRDNASVIGMSNISVTDQKRSRVPKPPMPAAGVSVGVVRQDAPGVIYSQDIQTVGGTKNWDVVVNAAKPNTDVTLSTNFIGSLPRNYRVTLTDKATGQTIDLRNQRAYRYNSGAVSPTRSFTITAKATTLGRRAIVSNVFVNPSASQQGRAAATYEIGYNISQEAQVEVSILSGSGRQIATVGTTRAANTGDNRVVWNGLDNSGRAIPAGSYVVQLRAVTQDGDVTRVVQPLLVSGR